MLILDPDRKAAIGDIVLMRGGNDEVVMREAILTEEGIAVNSYQDDKHKCIENLQVVAVLIEARRALH